MLKGERKLNTYLTNWFKENNIDVKCKLASDFEYDSDTKTVYYSLVIPDEHDKLFTKEVCRPLLKKNCNSFLLSLFHEVGHSKTEDQFTEDDNYDYYDMICNLSTKKKLTTKDYKIYYFNDIEYAATKWGCNYINRNINKVNKMYNEFLDIVNDFYRKNGVIYG